MTLPTLSAHVASILGDVLVERLRQETLKQEGRFPHTCADAEMSDATRLAVLVEEVGEVARALQRGAHDPKQDLRAELLQCSAICVAWIERIDAAGAARGA